MNPLIIGAIGFITLLGWLYLVSREKPHKPKDWRTLFEDDQH